MKKSMIIIILFYLFAVNSVFAREMDIKWSEGPDLPVRLSEIKAIAFDGKIYVMGGKISNDNSDMNDNANVDYTFEFGPETGKWIRKANMPVPAYDVALAVINDKIYAIGAETQMYDPVTDSWALKSPMPGGMAHMEAAVVENKIYVFGSDESSFNKTMQYDPANDTWTEKTAVPTPRLAPCVAEIEGQIYVMGGIGFDENNRLSKFLQTIEVYNPAADTWESKGPMPQILWGAEGVVVHQNDLYLINVRSTAGNPDHNCYSYHPGSETWAPIDTNLPKCYSEQGVAMLQNKIYVIAGCDSQFKQYDDVFVGEIENIKRKVW